MSHQAKSPNAMVPVATRPKTFEACPKKNRETPRHQEENTTAIRKSKNIDHTFPIIWANSSLMKLDADILEIHM